MVESCAVIVHWGDEQLTVEAVRRTLATGAFGAIVVIATDGKKCPPALADSPVTWKATARNLGYAGGCNAGVDEVKARKYAFLNADVWMDRASIESCLETLDTPTIGIVGPVLSLPDGRLQSACGTLSTLLWRPSAQRVPRSNSTSTDWVTGAALFCDGTVLKRLRWDGSYFLSYEDVDLCVRVRRAGWLVTVNSKARGVHETSGTLGDRAWEFYFARNGIWFGRRQGGLVRGLLVTVGAIAQLPRLVCGDLWRRRRSHALMQLRGIRAGWQSVPERGDPGAAEPVAARWMDWGT